MGSGLKSFLPPICFLPLVQGHNSPVTPRSSCALQPLPQGFLLPLRSLHSAGEIWKELCSSRIGTSSSTVIWEHVFHSGRQQSFPLGHFPFLTVSPWDLCSGRTTSPQRWCWSLSGCTRAQVWLLPMPPSTCRTWTPRTVSSSLWLPKVLTMVSPDTVGLEQERVCASECVSNTPDVRQKPGMFV